MTGDNEVGVKCVNSAAWWWLEVGWHGRRLLVVERRKGAGTPSSHDKRHLGTIDRGWKKKEINAACCRGHGDPPDADRVDKSESGGVMGTRAVGGGRGLHRRGGERAGRTSKRNGLLARTFLTHPSASVARLWPPISGRAGAAGLKMGAAWGCHLGSAHAQPGDRPCREGRSAATTPKRCGRK